MKRLTLANRLSIRIMMVLIVMSAVIMSVVYFITKDSMAREAESRYEGIIMHANEKIRGVLSDVYLGVITVACTEYNDMVRTSVTDTGRGIAPERREHIFDTFREMGDNVKLVGLGLSVCKVIAKLLGGDIWYDPDYQEGTRFVFEIPIKKQ